MGEAANALADFLNKMDQKLDALDGKVERYSAYMVKKMNDTSDTLVNMQTAQLKLLTENLDTMGKQISAMERQIGTHLSPDTNNDAVIAKLNETADALQLTLERSINLIGYHGDRLHRKLTESVQQVENGLRQHNLVIENPSAVPENPTCKIEGMDAVPENPTGKIEGIDAVPENPEGAFENPEVSVFENPEADYKILPDVPVENPDPVIET